MPCQDINDKITIILDNNYKVLDYHFAKLSCGAGIGKSNLLIFLLKNKKINDILNMSFVDIIDYYKPKDETEEFILAKHFIGLQMAAAVFLGESSGTINDTCTVDQIEYKENQIIYSCFLIVDLDTAKLRPCHTAEGKAVCGVTCNCVIGDYIKKEKYGKYN